METKKFYTVSRADVYNVNLGIVVCSLEASHSYHRVIVAETETLKIQNAVDMLEHDSEEDAKEFVEACSNAYHDRKQLEREQGI